MKVSSPQSKTSDKDLLQRHLDSLLKTTGATSPKGSTLENSRSNQRTGVSPSKNTSSLAGHTPKGGGQSKKGISN